MPAQPTWFPRLPLILEQLRALENVPYLDRQAFEALLEVKDRRARTLMARFAGTQLGNAWVVDRLALIEALERLQRGEEFRAERQRRQRIAASTSKRNGNTPRGKWKSPYRGRACGARSLLCPRACTLRPANCGSSSTGLKTSSENCLN